MAFSVASKSKNIDMTTGPLWNKILIYFFPLLLSTLVSRMFNAMDVAIISRFASTNELAATSAAGPIAGIIINLVAGLGIGVGVLMGQLIGAGDKQMARKVMHSAIFVGISGGLIISFIGIAFSKYFLKLTSTPAEIIDLSYLYLVITSLSKPFSVTATIGLAICQNMGDSKTSLITSAISAITNLVLNILFVVIFKWGVAGVAIATVVAQTIECILVLYRLTHNSDEYKLSIKEIKPNKEIISKIIKIGLPTSMQSMFNPLASAILISSYNMLGTTYLAAHSVSSTLESISFCVTVAFTGTAASFISQNYGAKKLDRCKKTLFITIGFSTVFTYLIDFIILAFKNNTIGFINTDPVIINLAAKRFMMITIGHFFLIVSDQLTSALRGFGKTLYPSVIYIVTFAGARILWVLVVFSIFKTYNSIIMVYPITFFLTALSMFIAYVINYKKIKTKFLE